MLGIGYTKKVVSVKLLRARQVIPLAFEVAVGEIEEGALVTLADGRAGLIQMISASPFHGETCQRAYCYAAMWELGERWASWELLGDLTVIG